MTFCIGWKTPTASFIIGDSALTTNDSSNQDIKIESSFKEPQGNINKNKCVFEGAYKIFSENDIGFALAGNAIFGRQLISEIIMRLEFGINIQVALSQAINNYPDFSSKPPIEILISYFDNKPRLFTLKNQRTQALVEESDLVIIGTPLPPLVQAVSEIYFTSTNYWLEHEGSPENDEVFFIKVLAILQGFGSHFNTMDRGIGGAYTGLYVTNTGIEFQKDICFVITGENPEHDTIKFASVQINKNLLCIINTDSPPLLVQNDFVGKITESEITQRNEVFYKSSLKNFDKGCFKYFIFINTFLHISTVIDMSYGHEHHLLNIDIREDRPGTLAFFMSNQLRKLINDNFKDIGKTQIPTVYYIPYHPASSEVKRHIENQKSKPRNNTSLTNEQMKYKLIINKEANDGDSPCPISEDEEFFGSESIILPFLKHYQNQSKITVIDVSTDFVVLEYESGQVIFPDDLGDLKTHFDQIPSKTRKEDIFLYDVYSDKNEGQPISISVLAKDEKEAMIKLTDKNIQEFGQEMPVIYSGKLFYHPSYY